MNKIEIITALAATSLVALWFTTSRAQDGREACPQECEQQATQCLEACGTEDDPMECESSCRNDAWECKTDC